MNLGYEVVDDDKCKNEHDVWELVRPYYKKRYKNSGLVALVIRRRDTSIIYYQWDNDEGKIQNECSKNRIAHILDILRELKDTFSVLSRKIGRYNDMEGIMFGVPHYLAIDIIERICLIYGKYIFLPQKDELTLKIFSN